MNVYTPIRPAHTQPDPLDRNRLDLFEAARIGDLPGLRAALTAHPDSLDHHAPDGFTPLGLATLHGHVDLVRCLLDAGADREMATANPTRARPLHLAATHPTKATTLTKLLLEAGADPNARQDAGHTPLHVAVQRQDRDLAALLLSHGASAHLSNDAGDSPFQIAHAQAQRGLIELLSTRPSRATE